MVRYLSPESGLICREQFSQSSFQAVVVSKDRFGRVRAVINTSCSQHCAKNEKNKVGYRFTGYKCKPYTERQKSEKQRGSHHTVASQGRLHFDAPRTESVKCWH